ncbi:MULTISPECIES: hypothetical protein [Bacillaceae]|uniref:Uncharacterized protein n=1 Tax=Peribacillus huizhouensis TaxID=1501239 RepID=A0ABR6CMC2_9BACI|nr:MULTISPECIES: hypothetical protein [Bacillaceae]MBA9026177.1 hypothetical protein [Peribacillus huizhouensis]
MKKEEKQHEKGTKISHAEELEIIFGYSNRKNGQPVPQPKDYDEIEY